jgi:hypothetical protein
MTGTSNVLGPISSSRARRERWVSLRDVLGGALLLAAWIALWTVTWAAVAGPLRPTEPMRAEAAAAVVRS